MQDKLTQNDIRFQQHSYCNTDINVILLGYCYNYQVQYSILMYHCVIGLNYVWISQDASSVSFDFVKQRIIDQFVQQW
jgi:hypothetical protein